MPVIKSKDGLSVKQRKFVKAYVENNGNGTKAALEAYDTNSEDVARSMAAENLAKPTIRVAVEKALEKADITIEKAVQPIADGLQATKTIPTTDGFVEGIDHGIRLKASGMALKLLGADQKEEKGNTFNFNFKGKTDASFNVGKYKE